MRQHAHPQMRSGLLYSRQGVHSSRLIQLCTAGPGWAAAKMLSEKMEDLNHDFPCGLLCPRREPNHYQTYLSYDFSLNFTATSLLE